MSFIFNKHWHKLLLIFLFTLAVYPTVIFADVFAPALLQIEEREDGWLDIIWKIRVL